MKKVVRQSQIYKQEVRYISTFASLICSTTQLSALHVTLRVESVLRMSKDRLVLHVLMANKNSITVANGIRLTVYCYPDDKA